MRVPRRFLIACTAVACAAVPLSGAIASPHVAVTMAADNGVKASTSSR
jgi:hypothetical protein